MIQDRTVLVCVGPTPRARAVAREGVRTAEQLGARPVFIQVGEDAAATEASLRTTVAAVAPAIEPTEDQVVVRAGTPGPAIVGAAEQVGAELIVMGALDRDPALTRLWGSVARHVARSAGCSVLLMPQPRSNMADYQRIVADVALNAVSWRMLELLVPLARRGHNTRLDFVYEYPISEALWVVRAHGAGGVGGAGGSVSVDEYMRQRQVVEEQVLREFLSGIDLSGLRTDLLAMPGRDGVAAIDHARQSAADLLAMPAPAQRLRFLDRVFHHPVEIALQRLPCRLLLYRDRV